VEQEPNNLRASFSRRKDSPVFDTKATATLPPWFSYAYFIGIFDNIDTAKAKLQLCISLDVSGTERKAVLDDYFIKEVELNKLYDLDWSNGCD
jgi:hypothetical protein